MQVQNLVAPVFVASRHSHGHVHVKSLVAVADASLGKPFAFVHVVREPVSFVVPKKIAPSRVIKRDKSQPLGIAFWAVFVEFWIPFLPTSSQRIGGQRKGHTTFSGASVDRKLSRGIGATKIPSLEISGRRT